jgi:N-acetylglutamate synthase-like GNAT family acetyltransferase
VHTYVVVALGRRGLESDGQDIAELRDIAVRDFFCEVGVARAVVFDFLADVWAPQLKTSAYLLPTYALLR